MAVKKVAILFGGVTPEHEVSLSSAFEILRAIDRTKFSPVEWGISKDGTWHIGDNAWEVVFAGADIAKLPANIAKRPVKSGVAAQVALKFPTYEILKSVDIVLPIIHGSNGEDGRWQGVFELVGLPIAGTTMLGSAICMNKSVTKEICIAAGVSVARGMRITAGESVSEDVLRAMVGNFPVFVKPESAGSSVGVSKCNTFLELSTSIELALQHDSAILIEEFIDHRELMVAVLGPYPDGRLVTSPVGEVVPSRELYDYADKYQLGTEVQVCPADLSPQIANEIMTLAVKAYRATRCNGMARVDCFLNKQTNRVLLNEINTIPGFTSMSHFPKFMAVVGRSMTDIITELIELGLSRAM